MQGVELKKDFSIGELSDAASVTARTIRYYVAEGLLARPRKAAAARPTTKSTLRACS